MASSLVETKEALGAQLSAIQSEQLQKQFEAQGSRINELEATIAEQQKTATETITAQSCPRVCLLMLKMPNTHNWQ